jgi:hypothetical protein
MYAGYLNNLRTATCDEPNDCASGIHNCDIYATCTPKNAQYGNKFSGFTCNCNEEYYGNGRSCAPLVNECDLGAHKCASDAICGDTKNGYTCTCKIGYVGSGYVCRIPVDECALGTHDCSVFATCTDLDNGYTCKCKAKEVISQKKNLSSFSKKAGLLIGRKIDYIKMQNERYWRVLTEKINYFLKLNT